VLQRLLCLCVLAAAIAPAAANADLTFSGCIRDTETMLACGPSAPALGGARGLALGPGGAQLYVATQDDASVDTFGVDLPTGALTFQRCVQSSTNRNGTSGECGSAVAEGLQYDTAIVLSPDGRFAYTGGTRLNVFSRDTTTGALTFIGCADRNGPGSPCSAHTDAFLTGVGGLAISPDGDSVYATTDGFTGPVDPANHHSALLAFARDATTGLLSEAGCVQDAGAPLGCAADAPGLLGPLGVAVSPGGDSVYVASRDTDAVTVFNRATAAPHALTAAGCIMQAGSATGCTTTAHGIERPSYVSVAPDGKTVAVTTDVGSSAVLTRAGSGALSFSGCIRGTGAGAAAPEADCANAAVAGSAGEFYVTPDGRNVYAGGRNVNALAIYARDPATGFMSYVQCVRDSVVTTVTGCAKSADGLHSVGQMQASADGRFLYVAIQGVFTNEGALLTFDRTPDMVTTPKPGAPRTVRAPKKPTLSLPLTCPTGATEFCTGEVVVTAGPKAAAARQRKPLARVKLARRTTAGRVRVKVRLPRAQRRHGTRLRVRIVRHNANGSRTTVTRRVRLR
jgi:DNA-binding beta-propeller fold protein YncE